MSSLSPGGTRSKSRPAPGPAGIAVEIDGKKKLVPAGEFLTEAADRLVAELEGANDAVVILTGEILRFTPAERLSALALFAATPGLTYRTRSKKVFGDLLSAVAAIVKYDADDLARSNTSRTVAIEAAAASASVESATAATFVVSLLKRSGFRGESAPRLRREIDALRGRLFAPAGDTGVRVRAVLPDAPVLEATIIPPGWTLTADGMTGPSGQVVSAPLLVTELGVDVRTRRETVTLAWPVGGAWRTLVVPRGDAADARRLVAHAAFGLPVTSVTAGAAVTFVETFTSANRGVLPLIHVTGRLGWNEERTSFLWGRESLTITGGETGTPAVLFRGADSGDEQIVNGFLAGGTADGWAAAVAPLADHPIATFVLAAALVPPLAPLVGAPNFVVSLAGPTSCGKTTILRASASLWGNPDDRAGATILFNWNSTGTFRDRLAAVCAHTPVFIDETQHVQDPRELVRTLYGVTQGRAKGRGTVAGIANQDPIETVLFLSGERPATSASEDGGTRARVFEFWGSPFAGSDIGPLVAAVGRGVREHFGHAGPAFVRLLLEQEAAWPDWRTRYGEYVAEYEDRAGGNAVAGRMAGYFAAVRLATELARTCPLTRWLPADPVSRVYEQLTAESGEADRAAAALRHVADYVAGHAEQFVNGRGLGDRAPANGWAGELPRGGGWENGWVRFLPKRLEEVLSAGGFSYETLLRQWRDRGWLNTDDGRSSRVVRLEGFSTRVVEITGHALSSVLTPSPRPLPTVPSGSGADEFLESLGVLEDPEVN